MPSDHYYLIGVIFAVLSGISNYLGLILQKKVVNKLSLSKQEDNFMKDLLKNPLWDFGLFLYIGVSTIFFMLAQYMIGPALVPGIMAIGLIMLVFGAVWIVKEKIKIWEIMGIIILISGIILLSLSKLVIDSSKINLYNKIIIFRIFLFSFILLIIWISLNFQFKKTLRYKAIFKSLAAGIPYCLSNMWITVLYASIVPVFNGNKSFVYISVFIISSIVLIITNIFGILEFQKAFKYGKVSRVVPIQQIPVQIAPIFYYHYVFVFRSENLRSYFYMVIGVILIIISGFILAKSREAIEFGDTYRG